MRILITGLDGFTGHYVKNELLAHGHANANGNANANKIIGLKSDLTDRDAVAAEIKQIQPEVVVHLAAIAFVGHGNSEDFYKVNLIGTRNLLEALYQSGSKITSILLASSANVYGNQSEGKLSEDCPLSPANDYAVSKFAMEKMAALWVNRLPLFIVRPFNYTGVGQNDNFLIPKIVNHFKSKASVIELGNLDVYREFNDVRMIAEIYSKLIKSAPIGETINVCTGKSYSLREIISLCEKITGHTIEVRVNPKFVRDNEVKTLMGDNQKLITLIRDLNTRSLEGTLRWMLYLDNNQEGYLKNA